MRWNPIHAIRRSRWMLSQYGNNKEKNIMRFLQRLHNDQVTSGDGDPGADGLLQQLRSEGDSLLAAGDEAIRRALAGSNSEDFLRTSRQQGGQ